MDGRVDEGLVDARAAAPPAAGPVPSRLTIAVGASGVGRAEAEAADRADVLLELGRRRALDRPVAAVVDARRQLVDDEGAVAAGGTARRSACRSGPWRSARRRPMSAAAAAIAVGDRGRRDRLEQDARVVHVPGDREGRGRAVDAAGDDDRQLRLEVELALGEQRRPGLARRGARWRRRSRRARRYGPGCGRRSRRSRPSAAAGRPSTSGPRAASQLVGRCGPPATARRRCRRPRRTAAPRVDPG